MDIPTHHQLMNPTLSALHSLGGSASIPEIVEHVITELRLDPEVIQQPHGESSKTEVEYRLAWARTYLKKSGMITNSERGVWSLTSEGARTQKVDPNEVVRLVRLQRRPSTAEDEVGDEGSSDETAAWREELLEMLLKMSPSGFERLCQRLLRESGFIEVEVTGRSGDGGIDGHGLIRVSGLISFPVLFQCKRHRDNIGASIVRDFRGAMIGRADKGLIITTAGFTRDARIEATRDGAPPIDLISGELLIDKLRELRLGVNTRLVEVIEVDSSWFEAI